MKRIICFMFIAASLLFPCKIYSLDISDLEITPNPFDPSSEQTCISFNVDKKTDITVGIYDAAENIKRRLLSGVVNPGNIKILWDGLDDYNSPLAEGSYFIKIYADQRAAFSGQVGSYIHFGLDCAYYDNLVLVTNALGHQIEIYNRFTGTLISRSGCFGAHVGEFGYPAGIAIDESYNVYVSDLLNNRIQKYNQATGQYEIFYSSGSSFYPFGLDYADNAIYCAYSGGMIKFDLDGNILISLSTGTQMRDIAKKDGTNRIFVVDNIADVVAGDMKYYTEVAGSFNFMGVVNNSALPNTSSEWSSISFDNTKNTYCYATYTNDQDENWGIYVAEDSLPPDIIKDFDFLQVNLTGFGLATGATNELWIAGMNMLSKFLYDPVTNLNSLSLGGMYAYSTALMFTPYDIHSRLIDNTLVISDIGTFPGASPLLGYDLDNITVVSSFGVWQFGKWGRKLKRLNMPTGITGQVNYTNFQDYTYVVNQGDTGDTNAGVIYRYDNDFNFVDTYVTGLENPTGADAFWTFLYLIEKDSVSGDGRVSMYNIYITSVPSTPPTPHLISSYDPDLKTAKDLAVNHFGESYITCSDKIVLYRIDYSSGLFYSETIADSLVEGSSYTGVAIDEFGKVYVYDGKNYEIDIYSRDGDYMTSIGRGKGYHQGFFNRVTSMDFDNDGNLWVAESGNHRVQIVTFHYRAYDQDIVTISDEVGTPYVSSFKINKEQPVIAGELEMEFTFSENMNNSLIPDINLIDGQHSNTYPVSIMHYEGNLCTATINITPDTGNGTARVIIKNAFDPDGHSIVPTTNTIQINTNVPEIVSRLINYPNPFSPKREKTTIIYYLNQDCDIDIGVYDLAGKRLWSQKFSGGGPNAQEGYENRVTWNGKDKNDKVLHNGVYILKVTAKGKRTGGEESLIRKIAILR